MIEPRGMMRMAVQRWRGLVDESSISAYGIVRIYVWDEDDAERAGIGSAE